MSIWQFTDGDGGGLFWIAQSRGNYAFFLYSLKILWSNTMIRLVLLNKCPVNAFRSHVVCSPRTLLASQKCLPNTTNFYVIRGVHDQKKQIRSTLNYMIALGVMTVGLSYAAVPLYRIFCQVCIIYNLIHFLPIGKLWYDSIIEPLKSGFLNFELSSIISLANNLLNLLIEICNLNKYLLIYFHQLPGPLV